MQEVAATPDRGRNRLVDTGSVLRLHRWWGTREIGWGEVERVVFAENGTAEGTRLGGAVDLLPRVLVHPRGGRRGRVVFAAFGAELGRQVERLEAGCAAHGIEVFDAGEDVRRRAGWDES